VPGAREPAEDREDVSAVRPTNYFEAQGVRTANRFTLERRVRGPRGRESRFRIAFAWAGRRDSRSGFSFVWPENENPVRDSRFE
jgi:hypothetical protein